MMQRVSALIVGTAAVAGLCGSALAGYTNPGLAFTATNAQGAASVSINLGQGAPLPGGGWQWVLFGPAIPIQTGGGVVLGSINQGTVTLNDTGALVAVSFAVTAGNSATNFIINSSVVSFSPMAMDGRASAGMTVTDNTGNGASITGNRPGGAMFSAHYNGAAPGGTTFANLITGPLVEPNAFGSEASNQSFPAAPGVFTPVGVVGDISTTWDFTVSANDQASGTSVWVVIPSPASLALLGAGVLVSGRRRR